MKFPLYFLFLSLTFFGLTPVKAQSGISLTVEPTITLNRGLNTVDIMLQNDTQEDFKGTLFLKLPKELTSIVGEQISVHIDAGKKRFIALRLTTVALSSLKKKQLNLELRNLDQKMVLQRTVQLDVPEKRSVFIQDVSPLQYFRQVGDSIHVKLQVVNNGTTDEQVNILFSSPDRIGDRNFKAMPISLRSGQDSLLQFSFVVERYMLNLAQYTVRITGIYSNSDVFGNASILFSNISSDRNFQKMFRVESNETVYSRNFVDFQVNNPFDSRSMYYLRSEGAYRLGDGKLRYSFSGTQFGDFGSNPNINSTFVEFEQGQMQATLGNIQESDEISIYGRGAKVAYWNEDKTNKVSAGFIEKSNDLLGFYNNGSLGFSAFSRLMLGAQEDGRKAYDGQVVYSKDNSDSTRSFLFANTFDLLPKDYDKNLKLTGFIGGGLYSSFANDVRTNATQPSGAFGLKANGRIDKWSYSSDNFFSTGYYTGNRRGVFQLMERISRNIGKGNYSLGYSYFEYSPEFVSKYFNTFKSTNSRVDVSINIPVSSFFNWNMQPYWSKESGQFLLNNQVSNLTSRSLQFMSSVNLRSRSYKHNLYLTTEAGLISVEDELKDKFVFRGNFSYGYKGLGLFGTYQRGAFQVYELINSIRLGREDEDRFTVGASYSGAFFRRKFVWSANSSASFAPISGNGYATNVNGSYRVATNTMVTSSLQYTYTKGPTGYDYSYSNFRIGVRQNLKGKNLDLPTEKTGNMKVFCFYDNNNNNVFDAGDEIADSFNFTVRNVLFITNRKGHATFNKMPYGEYALFFPMRNGYQGVTKRVEINSSSLLVEVPLQKIAIVKGSITINFDPNLSMEVDLNLDGYKIMAEDDQGRSFEVKSSQTGDFEFNLPQGEYTFYVDVASIPANMFINFNQQKMSVEVSKSYTLEPFVIDVKAKKVEVKRFGVR
ncbi:MSCRAMM family protein [Sphingobacterium sp. MYb382]|uniref:MSCRAMM family protein n=1 Tax=Sphingobacterium sp. MYb382 TaxID=2745278 RepID=UPI0030A5AF88